MLSLVIRRARKGDFPLLAEMFADCYRTEDPDFGECVPHWVLTEKQMRKSDLKFGKAYSGKVLVGGFAYVPFEDGYAVHYVFHDTSFSPEVIKQIAAHFIAKIWTSKRKDWVKFLVPDGQFETIKLLQELGCSAKLKPGWFAPLDGWELRFNASEDKKFSDLAKKRDR